MRRLVLKGSEWLRGQNARDGSYLLRSDGMMCCLGIDACSRGISEHDLQGITSPGVLFEEVDGRVAPEYFTDWAPGGDEPEDVVDAMFINDDRSIDDAERLARLRPIFQKRGITLVFRGDL